MKRSSLYQYISLALLSFSLSPAVHAQNAPAQDWTVSVGAGLMYAPAFLGADTYQLFALPVISIQYQDWLSLTPQNGLSARVFKRDGFDVNVNLGYDGGRKEDNDNSLRIGGNRSDALLGLGDVDSSAKLGTNVRYRFGSFSIGAGLDKALSSHKGMTINLNADYHQMLGSNHLTLGTNLVWADSDYTAAYFGITPEQSKRSKYKTYQAGSGLLSYGVSSSLRVPITPALSAIGFANYSRLSGDAADSPLVTEEGSRNQFYTGASLLYTF